MKKILVLSVVVLLNFVNVCAKDVNTAKQTHPALSTKKAALAKPVHAKAAGTSMAKIVYVDLYIKAGGTDTIKKRALLIDELFNAVKKGTVTAYTARVKYDPKYNNMFSKPVSFHKLMDQLKDTAIVNVINKDGDKIGTKPLVNDYAPSMMVGYCIKQEVYTDGKTNIVGIGPAKWLTLSNGDTLMGIHPVCWFKYSQCKKVLAGKPMLAGNTAYQVLFLGGKVKDL